MKNVTSTLWGIDLANCRRHGIVYEVYQYTTLNEKLDFLPDATLEPSDSFELKFMALGRGGHRTVQGGGGVDKPIPVPHLADHAALYSQMPVCIRPVEQDLTAGERTKYAGRTRITGPLDGRDYYAYWLIRLPVSDLRSTLLRNKIVDGKREKEIYETSSDNLNPVPPQLPPAGAVSTSGEFLSSSMILDAGLDEVAVRELYNVARILYGDESDAVVSEIAFCHGIDRNITLQTDQGTFSFKEAVAVQVDTFYSHYAPLSFFNRGFDLLIEFGGAESLLGAEMINTVTIIPRP